jgi:hypothetical protein
LLSSYHQAIYTKIRASALGQIPARVTPAFFTLYVKSYDELSAFTLIVTGSASLNVTGVSGRSRMGRARLQLALQSVAVDGNGYYVRTTSSPKIGRDHKKCNLAWIGGGAGGGALIGALAGGGTGALIGGPVGAGAGTTVALLTGKKDIKLAPETPVTFKLAEPVTIKVKG